MCEAVSQGGGGVAGTYETDFEDLHACDVDKRNSTKSGPPSQALDASSNLIALRSGAAA